VSPSVEETDLPVERRIGEPSKKIKSSSSAGQLLSEDDKQKFSKDQFDENRHNEMKLRPKHFQRSLNMSRTHLGTI
jgi:hypothetical protein